MPPRALLEYHPVLDKGQMPEILKSRGLPVRGIAAGRRSAASARWSSGVNFKVCSFAFAILGLLALLLIDVGDGGLVGKSMC